MTETTASPSPLSEGERTELAREHGGQPFLHVRDGPIGELGGEPNPAEFGESGAIPVGTQPDPYEARVAALGQAIDQLTAGESNGNRLLMLGIAAGTFIRQQCGGDVTAILAGLALLNTYASNVIGTTMALEALKAQGEAEALAVAQRAEAAAMAAAQSTDNSDPAWDTIKALHRERADDELADARHYVEAVRSGRCQPVGTMEEFEEAAAKLDELHALRLQAIEREPQEHAMVGHWLQNLTKAWAKHEQAQAAAQMLPFLRGQVIAYRSGVAELPEGMTLEAYEAQVEEVERLAADLRAGTMTAPDLPAPSGSGEVRDADPLPGVVEALENAPPRRDNGDPSGGKGLQEAIEE